jgi:hypothetical protein
VVFIFQLSVWVSPDYTETQTIFLVLGFRVSLFRKNENLLNCRLSGNYQTRILRKLSGNYQTPYAFTLSRCRSIPSVQHLSHSVNTSLPSGGFRYPFTLSKLSLLNPPKSFVLLSVRGISQV